MRRPFLSWLHLCAGVLGLVTFLITGQYMDRSLDHLRGMADAPRALYRSGHIYILFSALLNTLLGVYVSARSSTRLRLMQYLGSGLLVAALILFVYGFAVETPLALVERPMTRAAIEMSLAGVLLHTIAAVVPLRGRALTESSNRTSMGA